MKNTMMIEIDCRDIEEDKLMVAAKILKEGGSVVCWDILSTLCWGMVYL